MATTAMDVDELLESAAAEMQAKRAASTPKDNDHHRKDRKDDRDPAT